MTRTNTIGWALAAAFAISSLPVAWAADKPVIRPGKDPAVEVIRINPSKGDLRRVKEKQKQLPPGSALQEKVYVVKLYVEMPPARAGGPLLYIGDANQQFGSFAEGIFFKVYGEGDLQARRGQPVRFVHGKEIVELGITFPNEPAKETPGRLPELHEMLRSK